MKYRHQPPGGGGLTSDNKSVPVPFQAPPPQTGFDFARITCFRGKLLKLRQRGELATETASVRLQVMSTCYLVTADKQKKIHLI